MADVRRRPAVPVLGVVLCVLFSIAQANAQVRGSVPKNRYERLDSALGQMVLAVDSGQARGAAVGRLRNALVEGTSVPVTIRTSDVPSVSSWLLARGASIANVSPDTIEAYVTADHLRDLNSLASVRSVSQIVPAAERVVSQGVATHNAHNWQANGRLGAGVKVGIVDVGFKGFFDLMGTELPVAVTRRCYSTIGSFSSDLAACETVSNHGTAVAETLLDVAPAVQLFIANPKSNLDFRETLDWMTAQGARVINYSAARLWDGPGDGTSPYSDSPLKAVDSAAAGGAVFVTAAGNEATATYLGPFNDLTGDSWAEFPAGTDDNAVFLSAGERISIQLRWQDSWTGSARDLDLYLFNPSGQMVSSSVDTQAGGAFDAPFEFLSYVAPTSGTYIIGVYRYAGSTPAWVQLQNFSSQNLAFYTAGSIGSPAESANVSALAVGAARWSSLSAVEWFSSRGPTPDGRLKPDVVGVDGAETATYGPGGFLGTSQASPHIAGLAALVAEQFPAASAVQVANYLRAVANPGSGPKPNYEWGYGLAVLPNLCIYALSPTSATVPSGGAAITVDVSTGPACPWSPSSGATWITAGGATRTGAGSTLITVAPNSSRSMRSGQVTIGDQIVTITQRGRTLVTGDFNGDRRSDITVFRPGEGSWYTNYGGGAGGSATQWGLPDDVPVPGDYDGDGITDQAVYRPSTGVWYARASLVGPMSFSWGLPGDRPVPGDYDADGRTDFAVFRPASAEWHVLRTFEGAAAIQFGLLNDLPVPADYDGDGRTDLAVFRPSTAQWFVRTASGQITSEQFGLRHDVPVPADYDGDGLTDVAVYRPRTGTWFVKGSVPVNWGWSTDAPVPADYDGDGRADYAVYRPSAGTWFIKFANGATQMTQWGLVGDIAAVTQPASRPPARPGDFDGDGVTDTVVYRPSGGNWYLLRSALGPAALQWGLPNDRPVSGDYDGDGVVDIAVFRPDTAVWYLNMSTRGTSAVQFGLLDDVPVPADYDGDGATDIAVFRPSTATWYLKRSRLGQIAIAFGAPGDRPVPRDYTGDGIADLAVFRAASSRWIIKRQADELSIQWGLSGDVPVLGDYNGDGLTDFTVFRPGTATWYVRLNDGTATPFDAGMTSELTGIAWTSKQWGLLADTPVSGDYDGDGRTDIAVFRPGEGKWYVSRSSDEATAMVAWGLSGDLPVSGGSQ